MATKRKANSGFVESVEEPFAAPERPLETFFCGGPGSWTAEGFKGATGCLKMVPAGDYDFDALLCRGCSGAICREYGVPSRWAGALSCALRQYHRYVAAIPGLGELDKREAIRMMVIASRAQVDSPTTREETGGVKIFRKFRDMADFWPEEDRKTILGAIERAEQSKGVKT